jgi:hypothetical protein
MIHTLEQNHNGRDFVVGDLHGNYDMFMAGLDFLKFDPANDRVISVGDVIDRGPKSMECLQLNFQPWFRQIKGNHEHLMMQAVKHEGHRDLFFYNGGEWAMEYLGEIYRNEVYLDESADLLALTAILESAPDVIRMKVNGEWKYIVHAELPYYRPITAYSDTAEYQTKWTDELMASECINDILMTKDSSGSLPITWDRNIWRQIAWTELTPVRLNGLRAVFDEYIAPHIGEQFGTVISGHTILREPVRLPHHVNIDTGAFMPSGNLTFLELGTDRVFSVDKQNNVRETVFREA